MHNWWIAALEEFGLITREEAEHISDEIRNSIHKDRYKETFLEFHAIVEKKKFEVKKVIEELYSDIAELKLEVAKLKEAKESKKVATKK